MNREPHVVIEGCTLDVGQAMSLRVAVDVAISSFLEPDSCGDDDHGKTMRAGYLSRLREIEALLLRP